MNCKPSKWFKNRLKRLEMLAEKHAEAECYNPVHNEIIGLLPQEFRQNSFGAVDCVRRLVEAYQKQVVELHQWRNGFLQSPWVKQDPNKPIGTGPSMPTSGRAK